MRLPLTHDTFAQIAHSRWSNEPFNPVLHVSSRFLRRFKGCCGLTHEQVAECWNRLAVKKQLPKSTRPVDMMDTFFYMKNCATWESNSMTLKRDEKTLRKKVWSLMEAIAVQEWVSQ